MYLKESEIRNWANALAKIAESENLVDIFLKQSDVLIKVLKKYDDKLSRIFLIKTNEKTNDKLLMIDNIFKEFDINIYLLNTLKLLIKKQQFHSFRSILKKLYSELLEHKNIISGIIFSTYELDKETILKIQTKISQKMKKNILLINKINEKLIGGIKLVIDGKIFDSSISGKLNKLKELVIKKGEQYEL